jgi:hypothetical protein
MEKLGERRSGTLGLYHLGAFLIHGQLAKYSGCHTLESLYLLVNIFSTYESSSINVATVGAQAFLIGYP